MDIYYLISGLTLYLQYKTVDWQKDRKIKKESLEIGPREYNQLNFNKEANIIH